MRPRQRGTNSSRFDVKIGAAPPAALVLVGGSWPGPAAHYRPPRETRSISAFTIRSTRPGKLSSSQDFSIGRSISLTRSSRVRALLLKTVLARLLNADSTADTVERDRICCGGADG